MTTYMRNTSGEAVHVPALGSPGQPMLVEAGGTVEVPDGYEGTWPEELWEPATEGGATAEELRAEAKARGVTGYSGMTKAELAEAIEDAKRETGEAS